MAFEGHPDKPHTTKLECSATHTEETPVTSENDQEKYATCKIDVRTVLGILVINLVSTESIPIPSRLTMLQALAVTYESCLFSFVLPVSVLLNINQDIGASNNIAWVATAWSLSSAVVMTVAGRCSDIFGRRNFFLLGNSLGIIGCAINSRSFLA